jgi:hypothetical protein
MRQIQRALYFLFLFMLVSCTPAGTPTSTPDFSSLLQSSCSAPCWNGITPGKTTKAEFLKVIPSLPWYKDSTIGWMDEQGKVTQNVPDAPNSVAGMMIGKNLIGIYFKDSVVSVVTLMPTLDKSEESANHQPTLEKMVKLFGEPSNILKGGACADFKCQNLYFIYPEKGLIFIAESKDLVAQNGVFPSRIRVLPELYVQEVFFFEPSNFKSVPTSIEIGSIRCEIEDEIPDWPGYTTVDFSKVSSYCQ